MARSFTSGDKIVVSNNSLLDLASGSVSLFFKTSQAANYIFLTGRHDSLESRNGFIFFLFNTDQIYLSLKTNGPSEVCGIKGTSTTTRNGSWHHGAFTFNQANGATSRIYYDGTDEGSANNTASWTFNSQALQMAASVDSFWTSFAGTMAEYGMWDVNLTAAEFAALAKGASPLMIRPQNLVLYIPIVGRSSPEMDFINNLSGTLTGTANAAHPKIMYPTPAQARKFYATAITPSVRRYYRMMMGIGV